MQDSFYLPRIDETLESLAGAKYFSSIDLKSAYWQVRIKPECREYTAFSVGPLGHYENVRMPYGATNAPATFQRLMQRILGDLHLQGVVCYLDDLVIYSKTIEEHIELLSEVFKRLREANLKVAPNKTHLLRDSIDCLGHVVSKDGISVDPKKTAAVRNWPVPHNVKTLMQFLGFSNFYRKFVKDYSKIANPLLKLLKGHVHGKKGKKATQPQPKATKWEWGPEQSEAFSLLQWRHFGFG